MSSWRACALLVLVALGVAFTPLAFAEAELKRWSGPQQAPPLALKSLSGEPVTLAALKGRVVIVNFWATWCEPCVEEMPSLQALYDKLPRDSFEILAVNIKEGEPRIRGFLQKIPLNFPILRDTDGAVARAWKAGVYPSSYVIGADGTIRYLVVGNIDWTRADIEHKLRALLPRAQDRSR